MIPRGLIGAVHLPPLPGDPLYQGTDGFDGVERRALEDAAALIDGGIPALVVENFGSTPFNRGTRDDPAPPHQVAGLTRVAAKIRAALGCPLGVNCLRNDARAALGIAVAVGADFVRVNVHVGAMITDQGVIEGEAAETLRYRKVLGADIAILADVHVKHARPVTPVDIETAARDTVERGLADGLIVSGSATGAAPDPEDLRRVRAALPDTPLLVGSGLTADNAAALFALADAAIVGTSLKRDGMVRAPVDPQRVRRLVDAVAAVAR